MDLNILLDIPKFELRRFMEKSIEYSLTNFQNVLSQERAIKIDKVDSEFAFFMIMVFSLNNFKQHDINFILNENQFNHKEFLHQKVFADVCDALNYLPLLKALEKDIFAFFNEQKPSYNLSKVLQKYKEDRDLTDLFLYLNQNFLETKVLDFFSKTHHYSVKPLT